MIIDYLLIDSSETVHYCTTQLPLYPQDITRYICTRNLLFESLTLPIADITLHCQCDSLRNFLLIF